MKTNITFSCFLRKLRIVIYVLLFLDSLLILYKVFLLIHSECTCAKILALFTKWENLHFFLIALFGLVTLYVASTQLRKYIDMACINALIELRKQLTTGENRNVHFALSPEDEKKTIADELEEKNSGQVTLKDTGLKNHHEIPMIDVFNYLGTIELGAQMVIQKLIPIDIFFNQFGYRLENIFEEHSPIHKLIQKHINDNRSYYKDLRWIYNQIKNIT